MFYIVPALKHQHSYTTTSTIEQNTELQKNKKDLSNNEVNAIGFNECLNNGGKVTIINDDTFYQCEYKDKKFLKETGVKDIRDLFQKYIDEDFDFAFYFPKDSVIKTSNNSVSVLLAQKNVNVLEGYIMPKIKTKNDYFF